MACCGMGHDFWMFLAVAALVLHMTGVMESLARSQPSSSVSSSTPVEEEEAELPAAGGNATLKCTQLTSETEGPYWIEENIETCNLSANLSYGVPLHLTFKVVDAQLSSKHKRCVPVSLARIDIWHARYDGRYSDVEFEGTVGETWLRGYQFTNSSGYASFFSIYPGWYVSRTPHVHVRIRLYDMDNNSDYEATTQLFFDDSINGAIFKNVYPYNARPRRDTYNYDDPLYLDSNVISLVGNYTNPDGYNGIVEFSLPLIAEGGESGEISLA